MRIEQSLTGDFRGKDFSGQDLRGALFFKADLYRASFAGAHLEGSVLIDCFAAESNFSQARCSTLRARQCNFYRAEFSGADLTEALLWNCTLSGADLRGAQLRRLTLTLDCNSFEETQLDRAASAELAYLFARAQSPHRQNWLGVIGEGDRARLEHVFAS